MRKFISAMAAFALLAVIVSTAGATSPRPLPVQAAKQAALAPGHQLGMSVHRITPQEAFSASAGATDTEVGAGFQSRVARTLSRALAGGCWQGQLSYQWGTWPYSQTVNDYTYWCSNGSVLTYRTTHVTLSANGGLCSPHDAFGFKLGGGVGYSSETEQVGGYFDCSTATPWITLHYTRSMNVTVTAGGGMNRS